MKGFIIISIFVTLSGVTFGQNKQTSTDTSKLSELFIKKIIPFHCAKGPEKCDKCKELLNEGAKYCLIRVYYVSAGVITRLMIEMVVDGKKTSLEYDIENIFDNQEAAMKYSRQNSVKVLPN
ncbi:MAG: hypothetical protein WC868_09550 [Bacteroidales bacterium]